MSDPGIEALGWKPVFQQQLMAHPEHLQPARVCAVHRSGLTVAPQVAGNGEFALGGRWFVQSVEDRPTVGDWVLVDPHSGALAGLLERISLIKRLSPSGEIQLIAANVDTAFLVTSCNADFNLSRLERYLAVVVEADIHPVVVLTKADLADDPQAYVAQVRGLDSRLDVEAVNALEPEHLSGLAGWCGKGQTIVLLGSSGVGKSTLLNTLAGENLQVTKAARIEDDKGRHTTTHRSLHLLPQGGVVVDSPGMREFQVAEAASGVSAVFDDIEQLAQLCRFNDCRHGNEPGCAVQVAIEAGDLDSRRLQNYFKLQREERFNRETVAERHARSRQFARTVKVAQDVTHKKRTPT